MRGYHQTKPYATAMRKRRVWVEPRFAEAKNWHGLRRFRLRGLARVNSEALPIAAGQNLKRLLGQWGWGRRPFPGGAAGVTLLVPVPRSALNPCLPFVRWMAMCRVTSLFQQAGSFVRQE